MSDALTDYKDLYLSYRGRVSRSTFWLYMVLPFFLIELGAILVIIICGAMGVNETLLTGLSIVFAIIGIALI